MSVWYVCVHVCVHTHMHAINANICVCIIYIYLLSYFSFQLMFVCEQYQYNYVVDAYKSSLDNMHSVSTQGIFHRIINVHYYYCDQQGIQGDVCGYSSVS